MHKKPGIEDDAKKLTRISKRPAARDNVHAFLSRIENNPVSLRPNGEGKFGIPLTCDAPGRL
eukprot:2453377-Pyramimonas_sp.AAC.1